MTTTPDTLFVTGPNNQQLGAADIRVTPTGGTQGTLADVLASKGETLTPNAITGNDSSLDISGQSAAQGGSVTVVGGTSSTSANAGGQVNVTGGTPGATGIGGAVVIAAAAGLGGATGGLVSATAGAGQGTGAGGAASLVGGASGAGATGNGGAVAVTGGAAASTNGAGGNVSASGGASTGTGAGSSVILTPGAVSTGAAGGVFNRGLVVRNQPSPTALSGAATLTAAQVLTGILVSTTNAGAGVAYQMPTGTDLQNAFPADFTTNDDSMDFFIINASTNASDVITLTVNTDVTIVGQVTVQPNNAATTSPSSHWRVRRTGAHVFVVYRLA